jgi:hypothetical protein
MQIPDPAATASLSVLDTGKKGDQMTVSKSL